MAASSAVVTVVAGLWMLLLGNNRAAGLLLGVATVEVTIYVAFAVRAFKRDKAVQFWRERRQLRLDLGREEAYRWLLHQAFVQVRRLQGETAGRLPVEEALGRMAELTFHVFAPVHDDLAVLLVHQADARCEVVHSALSQGSRWHALRSGKHCVLEGNLKERLEELAPHHYAQPIGTTTGPLWFVVLHDSPMSRPESELLHPLPPIFELIANQKTAELAHQIPRLQVL